MAKLQQQQQKQQQGQPKQNRAGGGVSLELLFGSLSTQALAA
jgi:hypothetical protein